jgi:RNA polymerase sigma-70 factor (ECF subfamily)
MPAPVDAALIAELFDRHAAALALYASQWTAAGDDCVQEALVELARQPIAPDNPAAWLYRVVRNRALNAARAARRRTTHEQAAAEARAGGPRLSETGPADQAELADLIATLAPEAREIVVLRIWGQLAWREIAEVTGGSTSGAQRYYVQALQQLRQHWEPRKCPTN